MITTWNTVPTMIAQHPIAVIWFPGTNGTECGRSVPETQILPAGEARPQRAFSTVRGHPVFSTVRGHPVFSTVRGHPVELGTIGTPSSPGQLGPRRARGD